MPPRSSFAFLAAGPLMLAIAALLALPQDAAEAAPEDMVAGLERAVEF